MFSLWNNLAHGQLVFAVTVILVNTDVSFPDGTRLQTWVSFVLTEVPPSCTGGGRGRCWGGVWALLLRLVNVSAVRSGRNDNQVSIDRSFSNFGCKYQNSQQ